MAALSKRALALHFIAGLAVDHGMKGFFGNFWDPTMWKVEIINEQISGENESRALQ